ncbi:hypothetical protein JCM1840_005189 [Sporobolomyces johnsonii]
MNQDIWSQIGHQLDPYSVIQLSRTSRLLRHYFSLDVLDKHYFSLDVLDKHYLIGHSALPRPGGSACANPYGVALGAEKDDGLGAGAGACTPEGTKGTKGDSPFADYVERMHDQLGMPEQTTLLVRRPEEGVEEFETRQAEDKAELERRWVDTYGESTETVTLEAGRRV